MNKSILLFFWAGCLFLASLVNAQEPSESREMKGLSLLTEYLCLKPGDLSFRPDYTEPDSFRLGVVTELMKEPLGMIAYSASIRKAHVKRQPEILASVLFQDMVRSSQNSRGKAYRPSAAEMQRTYNLYYTDPTLGQLLSKAAIHIDVILPKSTEASLSALSREQRQFLRKEFKELLVIHEEEEFLSIEAIDSLDNAEMESAEKFAEFGRSIEKDPIVAAGIDMAREMLLEASNLRQMIRSGSLNPSDILSKKGFVPDNADLSSFLGRQPGWAVGGTSNDYYHGDYKFILDFGGDDVYDLSYDPANPHPVVIIDMSGNDLYRAQSDYTIGSGCFSAGLLFDFEGDDIYSGKSFAQGSGYFGFGLLYDAKGDDQYRGDSFLQGAGVFGLGLLIDEGGRDSYRAALNAQGFAFTEGYGLLFDTEGNDDYYAGGKYKDILRYADHFYSFAQGFSIGLRPVLSGGVGALIDGSGNDNYKTDIFGQASSYWWSLGMIYDGEGNDSYHSFQYAQGAGTHMSNGILVDDAGNDSYFSKGVSQGCGHDYSCGILLDRGGDDTYTAYDLSQAAGSANGFGLLIDNLGEDRYFIRNPKNSQGYGNPRREYGSIGLFIDLAGTDQYAGNGRDNYYWRTKSKWGGGLDIELDPPDSTEET
ncbi:MAG: hypothetical protein P1R58_13385, partial [bacterium]|nr:hypothetical protein [bacterium]